MNPTGARDEDSTRTSIRWDAEAEQRRDWLESEWLEVSLISMGNEKKKWGWR